MEDYNIGPKTLRLRPRLRLKPPLSLRLEPSAPKKTLQPTSGKKNKQQVLSNAAL